MTRTQVLSFGFLLVLLATLAAQAQAKTCQATGQCTGYYDYNGNWYWNSFQQATCPKDCYFEKQSSANNAANNVANGAYSEIQQAFASNQIDVTTASGQTQSQFLQNMYFTIQMAKSDATSSQNYGSSETCSTYLNCDYNYNPYYQYGGYQLSSTCSYTCSTCDHVHYAAAQTGDKSIQAITNAFMNNVIAYIGPNVTTQFDYQKSMENRICGKMNNAAGQQGCGGIRGSAYCAAPFGPGWGSSASTLIQPLAIVSVIAAFAGFLF